MGCDHFTQICSTFLLFIKTFGKRNAIVAFNKYKDDNDAQSESSASSLQDFDQDEDTKNNCLGCYQEKSNEKK